MKKIFTVLLGLLMYGIPASELFHCDFKDAGGKQKLSFGKFLLHSLKVPLRTEKGALRIAANAEITIEGTIPALDQYTVSAWILKKRDIDICPVLSLGEFGKNQPMVFTAGPELFARDKNLRCAGIRKGNRLKVSGVWKNLTAVYRDGECLLYVDGKLFDRTKVRLPLPAGNAVFHVGGEKNGLAPMYYSNADMLLNDLCLEDRALSENEIAARYASERKKYPEGNLTPPGKSPRHALEECFHYAPKGFDPELKSPLKIHAQYKEIPAPREAVKAEIRKEKDASPRLFIGGKEYFPYMFYMQKFINHNRFELDQAAPLAHDFASAGVPLCRIAIPSWHPYIGAVWKGEGEYDFEIMDRFVRTALRGNPGALLELVLPTSNPPPWFRKKYPKEAEMLLQSNGKLTSANAGGEIPSEVWKRVSEQLVRDLILHFEQQDFGKQIFGYCLCGGGSSEWYWPGTFRQGIPGYSEVTEQGFRRWLKKKYPTEGSLAAAWHQPGVTPETARVPSPAERQASETLFLRDPDKAAAVLDFRRYLTDRTTQCQTDLIRTAYKACDGKKLISLYCGYSFGNAMKHHLGGFNRSRDVMMLPECSCTQLAIVYGSTRQPGQDGFCVNPFNGSNRLCGKLLWHEADLRTPYLLNTVPEEYHNRHNTPEETADMIERNFAVAVTKGDGIYEFLLDGHAMYHDDTIMNAVARCAKAGKEIIRNPRKSAAETAVIFDESSMFYFAWPNRNNNHYFRNLLEDFYHNSSRAGFPMDFYFAEDMKDPEMPDYKFYIFLNQVEFRKDMADAIREKLDRNSASALWCMLPGIVDGKKFSAASMEQMTGFPFALSMKAEKISPVAEKGSELFSVRDRLPAFFCGPAAFPEGNGLTIHASFQGRPIIAEKRVGQHRALYSLIPPNPSMLRSFARYLGVHVWLDSPDVFSANGSHLLVHASKTGNKTLHFPCKTDVYDVFTGKRLFSNVSEFTLPLDFGKNLFLRIKQTELNNRRKK